MKTALQLARTAFLALLVAGAISACDTTSGFEQGTTDSEELELLAAELTSDLGLSADQQAALGTTMDRFGEGGARDPGFLWRLAAELSTTLTAEQKARLIDRAFAPPGNNGRGGGPGAGPPGRGQGNGSGGPLRDILTEDQVAAIEAIRDSYRAEIESLMQAIRDARDAGDDAAAQAAHDALKALHETARAEIDAWIQANLTQDQLDAIAAAEAEREAERAARQAEERAVMEEVLGISSDEGDAILAAVEAFREAFEGIDRDGDIAAQVEALVADLNAAVGAVLTDDTSFEIWQIHQALAVRAHRRGGKGGPQRGGPGGRPVGGGTGG